MVTDWYDKPVAQIQHRTLDKTVIIDASRRTKMDGSLCFMVRHDAPYALHIEKYQSPNQCHTHSNNE